MILVIQQHPDTNRDLIAYLRRRGLELDRWSTPRGYDPSLDGVDRIVFQCQEDFVLRDTELGAAALRLQGRAFERGIPIIQRPVAHANAVRTALAAHINASSALRAAGVRAARMVRLGWHDDPPLPYPYFIRDEYKHGSAQLLVECEADHRLAMKTASVALDHPIAVEFVDISHGGLFKKYRAVVVGDRTLPRHLIIGRDWSCRMADRIDNPAAREEELGYLRAGEPYADKLQAVRKLIGLDFGAFDYAIGEDGTLWIWEMNSLPNLWSTANANAPQKYEYQRPAVEHIYRAIAGLYAA